MAKLTGISKSALENYENDNYKEINHCNLVALAQFYNVSTDYLLCLTENKNHPNTDLTNLHLSDNMIDLLLCGFINNRLLCEIATHNKFKELMADTEIFVDGVATERFNDLNSSLESVRAKTINQNPNVSIDHTLRTLSAAQIVKKISSGNNIDKFIEIFCNSFQPKYKRLSEDQKEFLRKLFKKSPIVKNSVINFRKRKNSL